VEEQELAPALEPDGSLHVIAKYVIGEPIGPGRSSGLARLGLPSAPERMITVHDDPFRPQPRLDRDADGGMTTSVGRIRDDPALENGIKYVLVSHNTKMGAAKGAVLVAEYLATAGYL
jgi:aspartate-semialdehyde dehydrogenase